MTLDPITSATLALQIHVVSAAIAVLVGPIALYRTRRDIAHRLLGRVWVAAMAVLAVSSFFMPAAILPFVWIYGPIHLFAGWTLLSLTRGMRAIFRRDIATHQAVMRALYWQGLGVAGLFTLLPGRKLNEVLFGEAEMLGVWVIVGSLAMAAYVRWGWRPRRAAI